MKVDDLYRLEWLEPWGRVDRPAARGLEAELSKEVGPTHPLSGREYVAVGRRFDRDDVLFYLPGGPAPLVVVHLTWSGKEEDNPAWPHTTFYQSAEEWGSGCMRPANQELFGTF